MASITLASIAAVSPSVSFTATYKLQLSINSLVLLTIILICSIFGMVLWQARIQKSTSTSTSSSPPPCNGFSFRMNNSFTKVGGSSSRVRRACLFNPNQQPILKQALKEPSAFLGGIFAGLLRIDLNEDPLKEWVARTVEASGITEEQISNTTDAREEEDMPVQIDIE